MSLLNFSGKWFREFALLQFVKCFFGIIDFQGSNGVSCSEITEIIQPALAPKILYSVKQKFVFSFSQAFGLYSSVTRMRPRRRLCSLTFPFAVYRTVFSYRNLSIFILHWLSGPYCEVLQLIYWWYIDDKILNTYKKETEAASWLYWRIFLKLHTYKIAQVLFYYVECSVKCET